MSYSTTREQEKLLSKIPSPILGKRALLHPHLTVWDIRGKQKRNTEREGSGRESCGTIQTEASGDSWDSRGCTIFRYREGNISWPRSLPPGKGRPGMEEAEAALPTAQSVAALWPQDGQRGQQLLRAQRPSRMDPSSLICHCLSAACLYRKHVLVRLQWLLL